MAENRPDESVARGSDEPARAADAPIVMLDYAPGPRISRRTKRLIWLAALLLLIAAGWYWGRPYWRQAQVVLKERKLAHFKAPPGTVAFTNDPDEAKQLLAGGKHVRGDVHYIGSGNPYPPGLAGYAPTEADALFDPMLISWTTRGTLTYDKSNDPIGPPPTLFIGLRRSFGGKSRLVHVSLSLWWSSIADNPGRFVRGPEWESWSKEHWSGSVSVWELTLPAEVYAPATLRPGSTRKPVYSSDSLDRAFVVPNRMKRTDYGEMSYDVAKLRISYGGPDPSDESRILIPYECDGEKGRFVGTLKATQTGEKIEWEVEGPVKPWPEAM